MATREELAAEARRAVVKTADVARASAQAAFATLPSPVQTIAAEGAGVAGALFVGAKLVSPLVLPGRPAAQGVLFAAGGATLALVGGRRTTTGDAFVRGAGAGLVGLGLIRLVGALVPGVSPALGAIAGHFVPREARPIPGRPGMFLIDGGK